MGDQRLRQRLGVALAFGRKQQEFKQFVVGKSLSAAAQKALPEPLAMTGACVLCGNFCVPRQQNPQARRY